MAGEASDTKTVTVAKTDNTFGSNSSQSFQVWNHISSIFVDIDKDSRRIDRLEEKERKVWRVISDTIKTLEVREKLNKKVNCFNLSEEEEAKPGGNIGLVKKAVVTSPTRHASSFLTLEEKEKIKERLSHKCQLI